MTTPYAALRSLVEPLLRSLYLMASMVEARDPYTGGHLWRVSQFSRLLAEDLGLPQADVARITLGGFLHDLGKIGVPDAILNKAGKLTDEEYDVIKTHPDIGGRLLSGHPLGVLVRAAVTMHHETPDGRGYPGKLLGEAIPIDARIVGLTDAFDAMTSTRPYRAGMPVAKALAIIGENLGTQFDRDLGDRLIRLGSAGALNHVVGHSDLGIPLQVCNMCGPTIVTKRDQQSGDRVYCRCCGGESVFERNGGEVKLSRTGKVGTPQQIEPEVDEVLIWLCRTKSAARLGGLGG
jgi:hypothetical protein